MTYVVNVLVSYGAVLYGVCFLFVQAEDGIRDLVRSRGLGDVYKRQVRIRVLHCNFWMAAMPTRVLPAPQGSTMTPLPPLSLIHI